MSAPQSQHAVVFPSENDPLIDVRIRSRSQEPHIHHANIVLTALTDVIQAQGITAASSRSAITTAYFGALMLSIEQRSKHTTDTLAGIAHLLAIIFPQLPPSVLRAKAEDITPLLLQLLEQHADTTAIAKSTLACIATLLAALDPSAATYLHSANLSLYRALLVYSLDPRPKLRHLTQSKLALFLSSFTANNQQPPRPLMDALLSFAQREVEAVEGKESSEVLYLCGLLQTTAPTLTLTCAGHLMELLLSLPLKQHTILLVQVMRTLVALADRPATAAAQKVEVKHVVLLDRLLTALTTLLPHPSDIDANTAYLHTVERLVALLATMDAVRGGSRVLQYVEVLTPLLLSSKPTVVRITSHTMARFLQSGIKADWVRDVQARQGDEVERLLKTCESLLGYRYKSVWHQVFPIIAAVFAAFPQTIQLPSGPVHCLTLLSPLLSALDSLHSTADIAKDYGASIEDAIGAAIAYHGPEQLLTQLPLELPASTASPSEFTQQLAESRAWLLPLIRQHTRATTVASFFTAVLPHLTAMQSLAQRWDSEGQSTHRRACELLVEQLWDTWPSFCHWCVDVASMRQWAKRVGDWLTGNEWQHAQPLLARGLTVMIRDNELVVQEREEKAREEQQQQDEDAKEAARVFEEDEEDEEDDEKDNIKSKQSKSAHNKKDNKAAAAAAVIVKYPFDHSVLTLATAQSNLSILSSFAKNFLPLLFNLVSRIEHKRDVVLECVESYASISDATTINALFKRVLQRLLEADTAAMSGVVDVSVSDRAHVMSDIVLAMTSSLDETNVGLLWRSVEVQLSSSDAITQKKAYKLLSAICRHHPQYFAQHWQQILAAVTAATASLLPSAAKVRLTCLTALCLPIPPLLITAGDEGKQLLSHLPQLLGEVLLALKEPSFKTRSAAYGFINQLGQAMTAADTQLVQQNLIHTLDTWQLSSPDPLHPLFNEYLYMLLGGLAGTSPYMQSATVMAFSHLLFSCRADIPPAMTASLLSTFLPLLSSQSREVNKSMMGLVKVIALSLPADELRRYAAEILTGIGRWSEERRVRLQEKVKSVLEIMARKLGWDEVRGMVGEEQRRLVEHIRKMKERETKKKAEAWAKRKEARGEVDTAVDDAKKGRKGDDYENVLAGSEDEDEEEEKKEERGRQRRKKKERSREDGLSMREETGDLLASDMISNVGAMEERQQMVVSDEVGKKKKRKREVRENAEGKLLVMEEDDDEDDEKDRSTNDATQPKKNRSNKDERDRADDQPAKRRQLAGSAYAGKGGAGGDAKRRGQKFDPYAYIPLDPTVLNRRKQVSTRRRIEDTIGATKKGGKGGKAQQERGGESGGKKLYTHSKSHKKHKK